MKITHKTALLGAFLMLGCSKSPEENAAAPSTPATEEAKPAVAEAPPAPPAEPAASGSPSDKCKEQWTAGMGDVESRPANQRVAPALLAISGCKELLGELADAAGTAAPMPPKDRGAWLFGAANKAKPCKKAKLSGTGADAAKACPGGAMKVDAKSMKGIDAGTMLFVERTSEKMKAANILEGPGEKLLGTLVMATVAERAKPVPGKTTKTTAKKKRK